MTTDAMRWVREIKINLDTCKSCKNCVNACFVDVLRWDDKVKKPSVAYPEDCVWCLACEAACPVSAIEIVPVIPAPLRTSF